MLGLSGTSSYAVFVCLCILYLYFCICMFDTREYHFNILEQSSFQKYATCFFFCQKDPICGIFLKRGLFKDNKNHIPLCQICKYKNTNTQIRKYTNTVNDKVPQRPNMWYIFERRFLQGYQIYCIYHANILERCL